MDFVHIGNSNWNLVLHMLFGIRQSVVTAMNDDVYQLSEKDYSDKRRYEVHGFAQEQKNNYEFFDFCPRMFQMIRKFFGVTSEVYLKSIGPE